MKKTWMLLLWGACTVALADDPPYTICDCGDLAVIGACRTECARPPKEATKVIFGGGGGPSKWPGTLNRTDGDVFESVRKAGEIAREKAEAKRKELEMERAAGRVPADNYKGGILEYRESMGGYRVFMDQYRANRGIEGKGG